MKQPGGAPAPTDEELAAAAKGQNEAALTALLSRYLPVVKARVSGYAGGELEPEDLAQEGMIGLLNAVARYDEKRGASFHTFALLCIDRAVISVVRASLAARQIPSSTRVPLADEALADETGDDPEAIVTNRDALEQLLRRLPRELSPLERRVFFLYLGGCDYDAIAARLQISTKAVDNALCRVRGKIRRHGA